MNEGDSARWRAHVCALEKLSFVSCAVTGEVNLSENKLSYRTHHTWLTVCLSARGLGVV